MHTYYTPLVKALIIDTKLQVNKRDVHHIIIILFTYNTDKTKYTIIKTINIILLIEKFVALKKKWNFVQLYTKQDQYYIILDVTDFP